MPVLNTANNLYLGSQAASAAYLAGVKVWTLPIRTIFTQVANNNSAGNQGYSFRNVVPITGPGGTQLRVTLSGPVGSGQTVASHMSIGISPDGSGTMQGPFGSTSFNELFIGGVPGFSLGANAQAVTDWQDISGFAATDYLAFTYDAVNTAGSITCAFGRPPNCACLYLAGAHYSDIPWAGGNLGSIPFTVSKIEVR